ncbi:MAG: aldose 1-epimerase family protein [Erysipelotrichaceae bacterium]|nr:aldose 1-epimerase family protein [Erysipelotrichaceae bacterium]
MKLENDRYCLTVVEKAAEITSFYDKETKIEYMWQGDAKYWSGRNPILFPIVGNTYSKKYQIDGVEYAMGNHGLARHAMFQVVEETERSLTMEFVSDEETRKQYPFDFSLKVTYTLENDQVNIDYVVKNTGKKTMPFSFGLHPAFNCPLQEGKLEDYYVEFATEEPLYWFDRESKRFVEQKELTKRIPMTYEELTPTIMLEHVKSPYVRLTNGEHGVEVSCSGYRYLAFWTKPEAPFVCVEPWHGIADFEPNDTPFEKRPGTMLLEPEKEYRTSYYIRVY